jgi:putative transposase
MKASVEHIRQQFAFTERRACRLLRVPISSYRYKPRQNDAGLCERLVALAREKPRFGYRRLHVLLERQGEVVNHKRVHRIYREAGLALRRKKRKHCMRVSTPLGVYTAANQEWALDFVHDVLAAGRSIRVLNVIDAYTRQSLAMEVDTSFAGLRVTRVLDEIIAERGLPQGIRCDNGPELTSRHFLALALDRKIDLVHIQPGKPTQNAYVESFNSRLREECLRINWFQNLFEARRIIAAWRWDYNEQRPHSSLNYLTPAEFARRAGGRKDADSVRLKNDTAVFTFPPPRLRLVRQYYRCAEKGGRPTVRSSSLMTSAYAVIDGYAAGALKKNVVGDHPDWISPATART